MSTPSEPSDLLTAPHVVEYTYQRSVGPVLERFFTALRDRRPGAGCVSPGRSSPWRGPSRSRW
jgi:hypothetical protein